MRNHSQSEDTTMRREHEGCLGTSRLSCMNVFKLSLCAIVCTAASGLAAAHASAATYHAYLCRLPYGPNAGKPAPTDNTTYGYTGAYVWAAQSCGGGGAMSAGM